MHLAQTSKRSLVLPELASNLSEAGRKKTLAKFGGNAYTKTAMVLMGEPTEEHKERIQALILAEKQASSDAAFKAEKAAEKRKKLLEEKKRKAEEAKKAREAAQRKKAGGEE